MRVLSLLVLLTGLLVTLYSLNTESETLRSFDQVTQTQTQAHPDLALQLLDIGQLDPLLLQAVNVPIGQACAPALCSSDQDCPCGSCGDDSVCTQPW